MKFKSSKCKVLEQSDVKNTPKKLHAEFILVTADKSANSNSDNVVQEMLYQILGEGTWYTYHK